MRTTLSLLCALVLGLVCGAWGCSSSSGALSLRAPPRVALPPPGVESTGVSAPTLHITPGAVFLSGLTPEDGFEAGRWIGAEPSSDRWPGDEPRPLLGVGQIIDRRAGWARVELLALTGTTRSATLTPRLLDASTPPSLTKRVTHHLAELGGGQGRAPIGSVDLVTGDEIYGVVPIASLRGHRADRLASRLTSTVRLVPEEGHASRVETLAGSPPGAGDLLVLLGPHPTPALPVRLIVGRPPPNSPLTEQLLAQALRETLVAQRLDDVTIEESATILSKAAAREHLEDLADGALVAVLWSPDGGRWFVDSQHSRVTDHEPLASGLPVQRSADAPHLARDVAAHLHQLRGEHAAAAVLIERQLREAFDAAPRAAWSTYAPALIDSYAQLQRGDWALEVFLSLQAIAHERGVPDPASLLAAVRLGDPARIVAAADALADADPAGLSPATLVLLAGISARRGRARDARRWRAALEATGANPLVLARLDVEVAHAEGDRAGERAALEAAKIAASGALSTLEVEALRVEGLLLHDPDAGLQALQRFVARANDQGCPGLIQAALWRASRDDRFPPQVRVELLRFAAIGAHLARRPAAFAASVDAQHRLTPSPSPPPGLEAAYPRALATLDLRVQLGLYSLQQADARVTDPVAARPLLELARGLFLSVGDGTNVAVVNFNQAHLELTAGRLEDARRWLTLGQRFARLVRVKAVQTLGDQVEEALREATTRAGTEEGEDE